MRRTRGSARAIHVHEDITNHDHGHLVLLPLLTDLAQKLLVWARSHRLGDLRTLGIVFMTTERTNTARTR